MTQNNETKVLTPEQIENNKQQIIDIYRNCVKREDKQVICTARLSYKQEPFLYSPRKHTFSRCV